MVVGVVVEVTSTDNLHHAAALGSSPFMQGATPADSLENFQFWIISCANSVNGVEAHHRGNRDLNLVWDRLSEDQIQDVLEIWTYPEFVVELDLPANGLLHSFASIWLFRGSSCSQDRTVF